MKLELKNSLSLKLLRVVLLSALIVGVVLSCAQIIFDVYKTRQAVANDAQRILGMFRDPSTQAVYSLDREMGMQVIEGLFQHESVRVAAIGHPNEPVLADKSRELAKLATTNMFVWHACMIIALGMLSSGRAAILGYTMPIFSALIGAWLFGNVVNRRGWLGVGAAALGVLLLLWHEVLSPRGIGFDIACQEAGFAWRSLDPTAFAA